MKKCIAVGLFLVVLLSVSCVQAYEWKVETFLLPGINQAIEGKWVQACFFFSLDAVAITLMTQPTQVFVGTGHASDGSSIGYWITDYSRVTAGAILYGLSGTCASIDYNFNILKVRF